MTDQEQANIVEAILGDKSFCPNCQQPCDAVIRLTVNDAWGGKIRIRQVLACRPCWVMCVERGRSRADMMACADKVEILRGSKVTAIKDRWGAVSGDEDITSWF